MHRLLGYLLNRCNRVNICVINGAILFQKWIFFYFRKIHFLNVIIIIALELYSMKCIVLIESSILLNDLNSILFFYLSAVCTHLYPSNDWCEMQCAHCAWPAVSRIAFMSNTFNDHLRNELMGQFINSYFQSAFVSISLVSKQVAERLLMQRRKN